MVGGSDRQGSAPLAGLRVLVTRPAPQAAPLADGLVALGAEPVLFPTIEILPPADDGPLRRAAARLHPYDWLVFTSVNGVDRFCEQPALACKPGSERDRRWPRIACIGPATAAAVEARGLPVELVPDRYVAEALLESMERSPHPLAGARVLLCRAAEARDVLPQGLERLGARVDVVEAYRTRTVSPGPEAERVGRLLKEGRIHVLTFTSSSTVRGFAAAVGPCAGSALVAVIGPITAETARQAGLPVHVEAEEYSIAGLLRGLVDRVGGSAAPALEEEDR